MTHPSTSTNWGVDRPQGPDLPRQPPSPAQPGCPPVPTEAYSPSLAAPITLPKKPWLPRLFKWLVISVFVDLLLSAITLLIMLPYL